MKHHHKQRFKGKNETYFCVVLSGATATHGCTCTTRKEAGREESLWREMIRKKAAVEPTAPQQAAEG